MNNIEVYELVLNTLNLFPDRRGEVHCDCPMCGKEAKHGHVHFSFKYDDAMESAGGHCFKCGGNIGIRDLAKSLGLHVDDREPMDVGEYRLMRLEHQQKAQERKIDELAKRLSALERMAKCTDHIRYHEQMTDEQREYWRGEGIYEEAQDRFLLGYCPSCPTCQDSSSYTIPVRGYTNDLVGITHRLTSDVGGRYRPHIAGLGKQLFGANALSNPHERVIVIEGEKKSIVYQQHGYTTVGIMGKHGKWKTDWFDWFNRNIPVIIALDPDADESAWKLGEYFAQRNFDVRVAAFPHKPDDFIVRYGANLDDVEAVLMDARKV